MPEIALEIRGVTKRFPGMVAVNKVSFSIMQGEVHILMGENGAGKSTLVNMIAGILPIDEGELYLEGKQYHPANVVEAQKNGVNMVHQELSLMDNRTVAQNIFLGREPTKGKWLKTVDFARMNRESQQLIDDLHIAISSTTLTKDLGIALRQMVEVAKANSTKNKILILDEPTSSLTEPEIKSLFQIIRNLKEKGVSIIYISHRMNEIFQIGDRVTVMRDGCYIGTRNLSEINTDTLISMMIGRQLESRHARNPGEKGKVLLHTDKLTGLAFHNISLTVHTGEIVGLAGLVGAGRTELGKAIFGIDPIESGALSINGQTVDAKNHAPHKAIAMGLSFLPEDRKKEGLFLSFSIAVNMVSVILKKLFPGGITSKKKENAFAEENCRTYKVATTNAQKIVSGLSGGNQQKVVLAKWLATQSRLYIFDEPTRGIDIGAKSEIYRIMDLLTERGSGILMISSEMAELLAVADRILVMRDGELAGELVRDVDEFSEDNVLSLMLDNRSA